MKYSVVIPTYNHCNDLLKPCLENLFTVTDISNVEVIISANGCKDDTIKYVGTLREKFDYLGLKDNLKLIWNDDPIGFAKATNAGIKASTGEYVILLNNDAFLQTDFPRNYWLNAFQSSFDRNPKCGISCVLTRPSPITLREFAVFFCVMISRKVIDTIGLIDETFEVGGSEDIDYSIRAENAGFEIDVPLKMTWSDEAMLHVGGFPVYHRGEATVHDTSLVSNWEEKFFKNELRLAKKYNIEWYNLNKGSYEV